MISNISYLVLFFIINYTVGKRTSYQCQLDNDCADIVPNSRCINNQCRNKIRFRRQIRFGGRMLGDECERNDECRRTPLDGTKLCLLNQCQCSSGYVALDAYRCIRDLIQTSTNKQVTKTEEVSGYGSLCTTDKDCQRITTQLECLHGTCVCLEGYVPLGKYLCYNIRGQDAPRIESSTLTSTLLTRTTLRITQLNKPVIKLGNPCRNDYYCRRSIPRAHCFNGKCSCIDGYVSHDSISCIENNDKTHILDTTISTNYKSLLDGRCLTNENCYTLNAICFNNICTCSHGYFPIDSWHCLLDPDSFVETATSLQTASSTTTTEFVWWPWSLSSPSNSKDFFRLHCSHHRQCTNIDINSHCAVFGRCVCNIAYKLHMTNNEQKCIRQKLNEEDEDCD